MKTDTISNDQTATTNALFTEAESAATRQILAEELDVKLEQVTPNADLELDLGADSLTKVEIMMRLEDRFGTTIADDDAGVVNTVEDVYNALAKALGR